MWSMKVNQSSRGIYHLHLYDQRIRLARNRHESRWQTEQCCMSEDSTPHDSQCPNQDLNKAPAEHKSALLPHEPTSLVFNVVSTEMKQLTWLSKKETQLKEKFMLFSYISMANDQRLSKHTVRTRYMTTQIQLRQ
jgi:hypothetical protein